MFTDNVVFDLRLEPEYLRDAFELVLKTSGHTCTHYKIEPEYGLILYWAEDERLKLERVPPINIVDFVVDWFKEANINDFESKDDWDKRYPDGEVWSEIGFRMYTEDWGQVAGSFYAFIAIKPVYIWYGK